MSIVKNEAKYKNPLLKAIREQLEHRAYWLYLLCDEAGKRGLDWKEFGYPAIRRCGLDHGARHIAKGNTDSLKGLKKVLFTKPAQLVFEMDVLKSTDDELNIDFHYCPLVKAWQKAGCTDEEIATLCDIAMCGDHGIGEAYGAVLDLPKCIAKGDDICSLRYHKKKYVHQRLLPTRAAARLSKKAFGLFRQYFAVCRAQNLFADGKQIPPSQSVKYFLPGTRPGRK